MQKINICSLLSDKKKNGHVGEKIGVDNMNSGFGYIDKLIFDDIDIVIYRKEDIYKVLVHEIIHLYGLYLNGDEERIEECTKGIKELFVSV
jgi:hypothetical protein